MFSAALHSRCPNMRSIGKTFLRPNSWTYTPTRNKFDPLEFYQKNAKTPKQLKIKKEIETGVYSSLTKAPSYQTNCEMSEIIPKLTAKQFPNIMNVQCLGSRGVANVDREYFQQLCNQSNASFTFVIACKKRFFCEVSVQRWREVMQYYFPGIKIVELAIIDDPLWRKIKLLVNFSLRRIIKKLNPEDRTSCFVHYPQTTALFKTVVTTDSTDDLDMKVQYASYVYIVDHDGCIRFTAVGCAANEELIEKFRKHVDQLVQSYKPKSAS